MKTAKIPIDYFTNLSKRARNSAYKVIFDTYIELVRITGKDVHIILTKNLPKHKKQGEDIVPLIMQIHSMTEQDWDNFGEWLQEKFDNSPVVRRQKEIAEMWKNVNTK